MFTESDYNILHDLVFRPDYSGYKPTVIEIPNGDGKADSDKKYAHVAVKYMKTEQQRKDLMPFMEKAHAEATNMADEINLPNAFSPDIRYSALRILDYPPGSISNKHEDFDLFTLMLYRDQLDKFKSDETMTSWTLDVMREINPQAHMGQLGEEIGLGRATLHWVLPSESVQKSIVYFVIPDHDSILPSGIIIRDWLNERIQRSRTEHKAY